MAEKDNRQHVVVPHEKLSLEALQGLIEEFVTRDGTDTGYTKLTLGQRARQVKRQLERGDAVIVYDTATETANIVHKDGLSSESKDL